jgi:hypothetical protein
MDSALNAAGGNPGRVIDVAMLRDSAERQRADSEMITGLCDKVLALTNENQSLREELAKCKPKS